MVVVVGIVGLAVGGTLVVTFFGAVVVVVTLDMV